MEDETFWTLFRSGPHWLFELFLMALFDGLIGLLIWPKFRKWVLHHSSDDEKLDDLEKRLAKLEKSQLPDWMKSNMNGAKSTKVARTHHGGSHGSKVGQESSGKSET